MRLAAWVVGGVVGLAGAGVVNAQSLTVRNPSFESPTVTFEEQARPGADEWTTNGPVLQGGINPNTGIFPNSPQGQPGHIDNVDQNQVAYIGTQSGNEFAQALWADQGKTIPTTYEAGKAYSLVVAVAKSLFFPPAPSTANPTGLDALRLELFYLDASSVRQPVALLDVANNAASGLRDDHLIDFTAGSPLLALADAAVGKQVQVLVTTVGEAGGFFDFDNVRVSAATSVPEPAGLGAWVLAMAVVGRRRGKIGRGNEEARS